MTRAPRTSSTGSVGTSCVCSRGFASSQRRSLSAATACSAVQSMRSSFRRLVDEIVDHVTEVLRVVVRVKVIDVLVKHAVAPFVITGSCGRRRHAVENRAGIFRGSWSRFMWLEVREEHDDSSAPTP